MLKEDKKLCTKITRLHCQEYEILSKYIITKYNYKAVYDVYFLELNPKMMSGVKRKLLREQSVEFNKIMAFLLFHNKLLDESGIDNILMLDLLNDCNISKILYDL